MSDTARLGWGLAVAIQVGLVWLLARRSMQALGGWESGLGRPAVVLSFVALAGGVLVVLGGLLSRLRSRRAGPSVHRSPEGVDPRSRRDQAVVRMESATGQPLRLPQIAPAVTCGRQGFCFRPRR